MCHAACACSVFFISHDDKFVIKTMRKEEISLLLAGVPRYLQARSSTAAGRMRMTRKEETRMLLVAGSPTACGDCGLVEMMARSNSRMHHLRAPHQSCSTFVRIPTPC